MSDFRSPISPEQFQSFWDEHNESCTPQIRVIEIEVDTGKLMNATESEAAEYIRMIKYEFGKKFQAMLYKFYAQHPEAIKIPEPRPAN